MRGKPSQIPSHGTVAQLARKNASPGRTCHNLWRLPRKYKVRDRKTAFLKALAECGLIQNAAAAAEIRRETHYYWLRSDPEYAARFAEAQEMANDTIEGEAYYRAVHGVFEPNVFQGRFVYPQEEVEIEPAVLDRRGRVLQPARKEWRDVPGSAPLGVRRYSDRLLMFILARLRPERYGRGERIEVTVQSDELGRRLQRGRERMASTASEDAAE